MATWDDFLTWASKFAGAEDLEVEERSYKIEMAEKISDACELALESDGEWQSRLGKALSSSNILPWQFVDDVKKALAADAEGMRAAIVGLWRSTTPEAHLDEFAAALKSAGLGATPGNVTALGSVLLMGREPSQWPPYRAGFVHSWARAIGADPPGPSPYERFSTLLQLCDDLLHRAPETDLQVRDRLDAQGLAWAVLKHPAPVRWTPLDQAKLAAVRQGNDPGMAVVSRGAGSAPEAEAAAWLILEPGLRGRGSPFNPAVTTWTLDVATQLLRRIEADPLIGGTGFWQRFQGQLAGAPSEVILLAAEMMCLRLLPLENVKPETKVERVQQILSWGSSPREIPADLKRGLNAAGAFNAGRGYHQQAPKHLAWLCRLVQSWADLAQERRDEALADPFSFLEVTKSVPHDVPAMRYTLEYLVWPGTFPPVVSATDRQAIHTALMDDLGAPSGNEDHAITVDLVALYAYHGARDGRYPNWYGEPWAHRWRKGGEAGPRAWLIRPSEGGSALIQRWLDGGFMSLKAHMLGDVPAGSSESAVRTAVKAGYMHLDASQQEATTRAYHRFLSVMKADDVVVTLDQGTLRVGMITGEPEYVDESDSRLRRQVAWSTQSLPSSDLPAPLASRLEQQGTVVDLTSAYEELTSLIDVESDHVDDDEAPVLTVLAGGGEQGLSGGDTAYRREPPQLPTVPQELAERLYLPRASLQEMVDLLQTRQQMVFYGPPGTGKTFIAKELAKFLVGDDPSHHRLVQFHPSYSYEDFFEGYRPTLTDEGQATFELRSGPLKQMVSACEEPGNRGDPYILIIDEMNRANLAKVFGELYFLLEYRDETVQLQYQEPGETPFSLPRNLFVIGTMNTADRSIALVDAAIRRRFPFYEMHPGQEPVKDVLRQYLAAHGLSDDRARLLEALNDAMGVEGRDLHIGPSYFMRAAAEGEQGLERIWRYDILPLLEEHFYGQLDREMIHERFGLAAVRQRSDAQRSVAQSSEEAAAATEEGGAGSGDTGTADPTP